MINKAIYNVLADVFVYPDENFPRVVERAVGALQEACPEAAGHLSEFQELLPFGREEDPLLLMQEVYTRSFDVQAITTLDLGYVAFGDDYKRGELLVKLSAEHRKMEVDCGDELGDYLPNLLRLMAVHPDREMMAELVCLLIAPSLRQTVRQFVPTQLERKAELYRKHHKTVIDTPGKRYAMYGLALQALYQILQIDFELPEVTAPAEGTVDFTDTVGQELEIEKDEGVPLGGCQSDDVTDLAKGMPGSC